MLNNTNITNIKSALKDKVIVKTVSRKLAKPKTTLLIQLVQTRITNRWISLLHVCLYYTPYFLCRHGHEAFFESGGGGGGADSSKYLEK